MHATNAARPRAGSTEDAAKLIALAKGIGGDLELDDKLLTAFASQATGSIMPVSSFIGGTAAQEVMKARQSQFIHLDLSRAPYVLYGVK